MRRMTIRANGIDLDVRSVGDAGAPLLLFLHGFPEHADSWAEVMPEFAHRYHTQAASSYMHEPRDGDAERQLSADAYAGLMRKMARFGDVAWMTAEKRSAYLQAWSQPGALTGMLNWYRASPLVVPKVGEAVDMSKVPKLDAVQLRVRMPHLLIWGMEDEALLPISRGTLQDYCDHPVVVGEIEGADHWIVHQCREEVVALLKDFL
jgi:pimeloyl-ACP methyl ester carboxylesterase